jgi:eukaryotic-like serine/threonine-protein kinase
MALHPFAPTEVEAALGHRYIVGPEIAVGGQGVVFKATRKIKPDGSETNDDVALKVHLYRSQDIRVQREIDAMAKISHPTLARFIEDGYCDVAARHAPYVAWEFIDGVTLSDRLRSGGRLRESEVLAIGRDVSSAIAEIWLRRIVHGDIKPSNIMLKSDGSAVLIDLGAARYLEEDNSLAARRPFGTAGYLSPEQAKGSKALSCSSDIFSLGVVMLECLMGRHPTDNNQIPLEEGIRASQYKIAASTGLLCTLEKMLTLRPSFRPTPAGLGSYFQRQLRQMEEDFAVSARVAPKAENELAS